MEQKLEKLREKGMLHDAAYFAVLQILFDAKAEILDMINQWEKTLTPEDKSLYSLGLRRALDVLSGKNATEETEDE